MLGDPFLFRHRWPVGGAQQVGRFLFPLQEQGIQGRGDAATLEAADRPSSRTTRWATGEWTSRTYPEYAGEAVVCPALTSDQRFTKTQRPFAPCTQPATVTDRCCDDQVGGSWPTSPLPAVAGALTEKQTAMADSSAAALGGKEMTPLSGINLALEGFRRLTLKP